LKDLRFASIFR